jgi:hypothetical protein
MRHDILCTQLEFAFYYFLFNSYKIIEENFNANVLQHQAKIVLQIARRYNVTSLWAQPTIDVELV